MISLKNIQKAYYDSDPPTIALNNISFEIKQGEFVAIIGPSGSGKSTLLHILSFMDRPTSGVYTFFGKKMHDLSDAELAYIRNKEMGFVFQSFNLLGHASVYDNVEMPLLYSDVNIKDRKKLVENAITAVGLTDKIKVEAGKLSGGQKQRVAIARALVNDPRVIFADEPTGNLDSQSGAQVIKILEDLHAAGHTIILVTHETYTAQFANRTITIKDGGVESDKEIVKNQHHKFFK
jgi:putative ABC transport system ATP-binding protein